MQICSQDFYSSNIITYIYQFKISWNTPVHSGNSNLASLSLKIWLILNEGQLPKSIFVWIFCFVNTHILFMVNVGRYLNKNISKGFEICHHGVILLNSSFLLRGKKTCKGTPTRDVLHLHFYPPSSGLARLIKIDKWFLNKVDFQICGKMIIHRD